MSDRVTLLRENVVWQKFFLHKCHTLNRSALPKAAKLWFYCNGRQMCNHLSVVSEPSSEAWVGAHLHRFVRVCLPAHQPVQEVSWGWNLWVPKRQLALLRRPSAGRDGKMSCLPSAASNVSKFQFNLLPEHRVSEWPTAAALQASRRSCNCLQSIKTASLHWNQSQKSDYSHLNTSLYTTQICLFCSICTSSVFLFFSSLELKVTLALALAERCQPLRPRWVTAMWCWFVPWYSVPMCLLRLHSP